MTLPPLDYTAVFLAVLSVISTITLGLLQFVKWKAEAKKARVEAQTDLVKTALEINRQEMQTLRDVIQVQKDMLHEKDSLLEERGKTIEYLRTQKEGKDATDRKE